MSNQNALLNGSIDTSTRILGVNLNPVAMQNKSLRAGHRTFFVVSLLIGLTIQPCDAVEIKTGVLPPRAEPYIFTESVKVPMGKVLTVEAGAVLCFAPNAELMITGILEVNGTKDKPVVFSSCAPDSSWRGISFNTSRAYKGKKNLLQYAIVERANKSKRDARGQPEREKGEGIENGGGIQVVQSDVDIADSVIRFNTASNGGGLYIGAGSSVTVRRCLIHSNRALGSNFIYSGGGGIYIADPQRASIWRSTIALNSFSSPGYGNEEGGGGLYLEGKGLQMGFNLVVGNESGKGAGLLLHSQAERVKENPLFLIGNVFAYNHGSRNFEQVALETKFSFQHTASLNMWFTNMGQFPFVAHLIRERLVRYVDNGDKTLLRHIVPNTPESTSPFGQLIADRLSKEDIRAYAGDVVAESQFCKSRFDLGPLELCDAVDRPTLREYVDRLAARHGDHEFGRRLLGLLYPGPNLSDFAPMFRYAAEKVSDNVPEEYLVMAIGSDEMRAKIIDQLLRYPIRAREARGFAIALWAYALGDNQAFRLLVQNPVYAKEVFLNAASNGFVDAALQAYAEAIDSEDPDPEFMRQAMGIATSNGLTELVERLLDDGLNPDLDFYGMRPLVRAASFGQKDVVQLLLRRGANPNLLVPTQRKPVPLLYPSVISYHLGEGFRDIAEMLLAAGADFGSPRFDEYDPSPYFLRNILQLGYTLPPGISGTPTDYMRVEENEDATRLAERIKRGEFVETPMIAKIRELRGKDTKTILEDFSSSSTHERKDSWQLAAALRILSVRDFDFDETNRRSLIEAYGGKHGSELRKLVPLDEVFPKFRRGLPQKGSEPIAKAPIAEADRELPYGRKIAVVIGIDKYKNLSSNLSFAEKDATDFKELLRSGRMGSNWQIEEMIGPAATYEAVDLTLKSLRSGLRENDLLLFFFSGHGFSDKDQESAYLFFQDSSRNKLSQTALSLGTLREWAIGLRAKHVILFLDACRSGLLGTAKGISTMSYAALDAAQFRQSSGKVAITSSIGADESYEWTDRRNGFFTALLISALTEHIARPKSGSYLTIKDVFAALTRELPIVTQSQPLQQIPWLFPLDGIMVDFPIAITQ